jgi:hypothetical protein
LYNCLWQNIHIPNAIKPLHAQTNMIKPTDYYLPGGRSGALTKCIPEETAGEP